MASTSQRNCRGTTSARRDGSRVGERASGSQGESGGGALCTRDEEVKEADADVERAGEVREVGGLLGKGLDERHTLLVVLPALSEVVCACPSR
jgi:hypothetical protein